MADGEGMKSGNRPESEYNSRMTSLKSVTGSSLAFFILILCGCGGESHLAGDGGSDDGRAEGDAPSEAEAAPDPVDERTDELAPPDVTPDVTPDVDRDGECFEEAYWALQPRHIASISLVDGSSRMGVTERLLVEVQLQGGCERLGKLDVNLMPGDATDFVELAASAWVPVGGACDPSAPLVTRVVTIPGREQGNMMVSVRDVNFPDGGVGIHYGRAPCSGIPECQCYGGSPPGDGEEWSDCVTDCSCRPEFACIGYYGIGGPMWSCARICSDFMDCPPREDCLPPIPDGAPYTCSYNGDLCDGDGDCPDGFVCTFTDMASFCEDKRAFPSAAPCRCDADCPEGQLCANSVHGGPTCEVPCLSESQCPNPDIQVFTCGTPGICVPLE